MSTAPPPDTKPSFQVDWQEWLPYIEDNKLTDNQKRELIETLWTIVIAFVDLGWDISNAPKETGGQVLDLKAALEAAVVNSRVKQKEEKA